MSELTKSELTKSELTKSELTKSERKQIAEILDRRANEIERLHRGVRRFAAVNVK